MKRTRIRAKAVGWFARLEDALDKLWSAAVLRRDKGLCQMCLPQRVPATDPHHIFTRKFKSTRWLRDNGVSLCRGCHDKAHAHPTAFLNWACGWFLRTHLMEEWTALVVTANSPIASPDAAWYDERKRELELMA